MPFSASVSSLGMIHSLFASPSRELRQHLQVLVAEQLRVGVALVDGVEDGQDRLGLALGAQHRRLGVALGLRGSPPAAAPSAVRICRLLRALGGEDERAPVTLGAHLLLHRVLDGVGRVDRLELDAADADAPLAGRLVEHDAQLAVDVVARGERLFEVQSADHVAQCRRRELLDRAEVVRDLVGRRPGIGHLEVDDRVDRDDEVVFGDDRLRRERDDLSRACRRAGAARSMNGTRMFRPGMRVLW